MKTLRIIWLFTGFLVAIIAITAPVYARKVVWISQDPDNPNDKSFAEGYYKQIKQPNDTLQVGGDPNLIWCTMQAGDTFVIVAHGETTFIDHGNGNTTTIDGGGIVINGNGHAGFGPQGPTVGGTGLPGATPFELQPKTGMDVTVMIISCWSSNATPSENVRAVTESFDGTLVGAGSTIIGAQSTVQFCDIEFRALGRRADVERLQERLQVLCGANSMAGVYGWMDSQPQNRHQFVLDSIRAAENLVLEVAVFTYSPPVGLDGSLAIHNRKYQRFEYRVDDGPDDFIDTTYAHYVSTTPCENPPPVVEIAANRCLQFTPYGSIEVQWSSDLPGPPVFTISAGCSDPCGNNSCTPVNVILVATGPVANQPGVWSAVFSNPNAEAGCACIMLDAMLPVELADFTASASEEFIRLDWSTYSETDAASFQIFRHNEREQSFTPLSPHIDATGTPASGSRYVYDDRAAHFGVVYSYLLVEISTSGAETRFEDRIVSASLLDQTALPLHLSLAQNSPNPFNASTTIQFDLNVSSFTTLTLFDLQGRDVKRLVEQELSAGEHTVRFDAGELPSGVYIYRLTSDGRSLQKKLVLLR